MKKLLRLVAVLLPLACSSSTAPGPAPRLDFVAVASSAPGAPDWATSPPSVRVSGGRIDVAGLIPSGACVDVRAETDRDARRISLDVIARARDVVCIQILLDFAYLATIDGLEPGSYQLSVTHAWEDPSGVRREAEHVLYKSVTVP